MVERGCPAQPDLRWGEMSFLLRNWQVNLSWHGRLARVAAFAWARRPCHGLAAALVILCTAIPAMAQSPNDQFYPLSWHHQQIGSERAWAINGGSRSVVVAVIDTGVDASNPDLV